MATTKQSPVEAGWYHACKRRGLKEVEGKAEDCPECNESNIIYVYSDSEALEDGVLIDITALRLSFDCTPVDRITHTVYADCEALADLINRFNSGEAVDALTVPQVIADTYMARIHTARDSDGDGRIITLPSATGDDSMTLWLVRNERECYTLMNPSDY